MLVDPVPYIYYPSLKLFLCSALAYMYCGYVQLQEYIKIEDLSTGDQAVDSSENPIVNWLAKNGIKKMAVIYSECETQSEDDKEQGNSNSKSKPEDDRVQEDNVCETQTKDGKEQGNSDDKSKPEDERVQEDNDHVRKAAHVSYNYL